MSTIQAESSGPGGSVSEKLRRAWKKERRFVHLRGACAVLLWLIALVLLDLGVDWLFYVAPLAMRILEALNVVTLGWIVYSRWLRQLKPYNPVRLALQVEKRHPELKSLLVSYVQFSGQSGEGTHVSPALLQALKDQALVATAPLNFKEIVNYRELRKILVFSSCVLVVFAALTVRGSPFFNALLTRMVDPASQILYPTRTQLGYVTGDVTVPYGAAATLTARVSGLVPAEGTLYLKSKDGNWEKLSRALQGKDTYEYRFETVYQNFDYYFRIGDVKTPVHHVKAVPAPRVVSPLITLHYPGYTQLEDRPIKALMLQGVPEGTVLEWRLATDQPLAEASIIKDGRELYRMALSADGKVATGKIQALESFAYQFKWKEKAHKFEYTEDVRYSVQVQPDAPPEVAILYPPEDEKGTVKKTLEVVYRAGNAYGLSAATLVYAVDDGPEKRMALETLTGKSATKAVKRALAEDIKGLKEKMVISYYIEVADKRDLTPAVAVTAGQAIGRAATGPATGPAAKSMGANVGKSPSRRMEVVTPEEYAAYVQEKKARLLSDVGPLYSEESEADKEIKAVIKELLGHATGP